MGLTGGAAGIVAILATIGGAAACIQAVYLYVRARRSTHEPTVGRRFRDHIVVRVIREAHGYRYVYVARGRWRDRNKRLHKLALVKAFKLESAPADLSARRIAAEYRALARCESRFISAPLGPAPSASPDQAGTWSILYQELLRGSNLTEHRFRSSFESNALTALFLGTASGVAAAHSAGLIHRDLKPANVMLTDRGPVIADFGSVRIAEEQRLTQSGSAIAPVSVDFAAPEQLDPSRPDITPAADIYSLGLVMLYAEAGRPIRPEDPEYDSCIIDLGDLGPLVGRCVADRPEDRISASELRLALRRIAIAHLNAASSAISDELLVAQLWQIRAKEQRLPMALTTRAAAPFAAVVAILVALAAGLLPTSDPDDTALPSTSPTARSTPTTSHKASTTQSTTTTALTTTTATTTTTHPPSSRSTEPAPSPVTTVASAPATTVDRTPSVTFVPTSYCDGTPIARGTDVGAAANGILKWNDVWDGSPADMTYAVYVLDPSCNARFVVNMSRHTNVTVPAELGDTIEWRYTRNGDPGQNAGEEAGSLYLYENNQSAWVPYGCC